LSVVCVCVSVYNSETAAVLLHIIIMYLSLLLQSQLLCVKLPQLPLVV